LSQQEQVKSSENQNHELREQIEMSNKQMEYMQQQLQMKEITMQNSGSIPSLHRDSSIAMMSNVSQNNERVRYEATKNILKEKDKEI
jgi:hypothetical protein